MTCAACLSSAAGCAEHTTEATMKKKIAPTPAVDPTATVLRALTAARWDVELHNTGTTARVKLRPPVSWEGEPLEVHGPTLDEAVAAAWRRALVEQDPGLIVAGRMAGLP